MSLAPRRWRRRIVSTAAGGGTALIYVETLREVACEMSRRSSESVLSV